MSAIQNGLDALLRVTHALEQLLILLLGDTWRQRLAEAALWSLEVLDSWREHVTELFLGFCWLVALFRLGLRLSRKLLRLNLLQIIM